MRRILVLLASLCVLLPLSVASGVAREATPTGASAFADLGLPTLDITVTATGYEGIPESLEAGRYLVTVTAAADAGEFGGGVNFIQPAEMGGQQFIDLFLQMGPPDETGVGSAAATPVEGAVPEASPAGGESGDMGGPPAFYFESGFAGGAFAAPGLSAQVVLT